MPGLDQNLQPLWLTVDNEKFESDENLPKQKYTQIMYWKPNLTLFLKGLIILELGFFLHI